MLVMFEFEGRDFIVRATPFGKNGYHHGKVLYADPKQEIIPPEPVQAKLIVQAEYRPPSKTIDEARKHKRLSTWDGRAKDFWLWLVERKKTSGLVSALYTEYAKANGEKRSPQMAFYLAAAGERLDFWKIRENKERTRFTLEVQP
jgi:hypothetical protein